MNRKLSSKLALAAALPLAFGVVACENGIDEPVDDVNGEFEENGLEDDGLDDDMDDDMDEDGDL
ncbi:MAG: hypothetical protein EA388_04455 [Nitriliruptor sp.]|nr:MAG: hypothetical protein EA388_04455 [Nitriliruptor sp.]